MKLKYTDKKKLQRERNILTAQLSRDRKKLEVELLRLNCIQAIESLNKVRNTLLKLEHVQKKCKNKEISRIQTRHLLADVQFIFKNGHEYEMTLKRDNNDSSDTLSQDDIEATHSHCSKVASLSNLSPGADSSDNVSSFQQEVRKDKKIEFKKYATKPGLVKRLTRVKLT